MTYLELMQKHGLTDANSPAPIQEKIKAYSGIYDRFETAEKAFEAEENEENEKALDAALAECDKANDELVAMIEAHVKTLPKEQPAQEQQPKVEQPVPAGTPTTEEPAEKKGGGIGMAIGLSLFLGVVSFGAIRMFNRN